MSEIHLISFFTLFQLITVYTNKLMLLGGFEPPSGG